LERVSTIKHPAVAEARRRTGQLGGHGPDCYLADGYRLVHQAVDARAPAAALFFLDPPSKAHAGLLERAEALGIPCYAAGRGVFFKVLGLGYETSVKVLGVLRRPPPADLTEAEDCVLVGERVQDPRNVGVIVRTADAHGLSLVAFSADSADPYSRAAVRSSTGSIFRLRLALPQDLPEALSALQARGLRVIGTSARGGGECWNADLAGPCAILLGNETEGLSDAARAACSEMVTISMCGGAHSLNVTVAAGILLYERARQRFSLW
jgi:TrmH family RNA methyltransferase